MDVVVVRFLEDVNVPVEFEFDVVVVVVVVTGTVNGGGGFLHRNKEDSWVDDSDVFDGATVERNRRRTWNRCRRSRMVIVYTMQYNNIVVIYYSKNNSQQKSLFLIYIFTVSCTSFLRFWLFALRWKNLSYHDCLAGMSYHHWKWKTIWTRRPLCIAHARHNLSEFHNSQVWRTPFSF